MLTIPFIKLALLLAPLLLNEAGAAMAAPSVANALAFSTIGNIAAVEDTGFGGSRLYSQNANGDIVQTCVRGPFTTGSSSASTCGKNATNFVVVPANEALYRTPLAVTGLEEESNGVVIPIHLFFLSPDRIVSEYIWQGDFVWNNGSSCTECITNEGLLVAEGSEALYAMGSTNASHAFRVGFISAGAPQTVTEAVFNSDTGHWETAGLPN